MTEFELNLRLKQEMENLAPNRLGELLAACGEQTPVQPEVIQMPRRSRRLPRLIAAVAAVVILASGVFYGVKDHQRSIVTVDAGAELAMTVNGFNRVKSVTVEGLETDADALRGMQADDAAEAFVRQLMDLDVIGGSANGVLVSVRDAGAKRTAAIGQTISRGIERATAAEQFSPAVLLQHLTGEDSGMTALTRAVAENSTGIDLDTAGTLSLQELLYVVDSQSLQWEDASLSGTLMTWRCADGHDAEQLVTNYVGAQAEEFVTSLGVYAEQLAYSVQFSVGSDWLNYWVSAATGEILNPDAWRPAVTPPDPEQTPSTNTIPMPAPGDYRDQRRKIHDFFDFIDDLI